MRIQQLAAATLLALSAWASGAAAQSPAAPSAPTSAVASAAQTGGLTPTLVAPLAGTDFDAKAAALDAVLQRADSSPQASQLALALQNDNAFATEAGRVLVKEGSAYHDAATGDVVDVGSESPRQIMVNNVLRTKLESAGASLQLQNADPKVRAKAIATMAAAPRAEMLPVLERAMAQEKDSKLHASLQSTWALAALRSPDLAVQLKGVQVLGQGQDPKALAVLEPLAKQTEQPELAAAAQTAAKEIQQRQRVGEISGNIFQGVSAGSILLLAALGLAITYGLMGVINMAHGEFLMIGAYASYVVQLLFKHYAPGALDWYVVAALPVAFISSALVGVLIEWAVLRHLYSRPLETLLATFGVSLLLIQTVRTIFGAQNVEVANPTWLSGGWQVLPNLVLPYNRIAIIIFAFAVLALAWVVINKTRLGLFVRAVTQNRTMAGCVGVRAPSIDRYAFAFGAGIAGLGGVALSQAGASVVPDMGQGFIIDSFMAVVVGGVGQLAGTVTGAMGLGVLSKVMEPYFGAVLAKIAILMLVIVFIQRRPQGIFALKGRSVEA